MHLIRSPVLIYSLLFSLFLVSVNCGREKHKPSVIIVGAGAAGIAAASKLLENGINNIVILEAESRNGGRINSVQFEDAVVDLGAQWCHGEENNIVYELVKDLDLLEHGKLFISLYHSSRKHLDPTFGEELFELYTSIYKDEIENNDISLGQYILERYNKTIIEQFGEDTEKLNLALDSLDIISKWTVATEGAFSWFDPAAKNDYTECEGNQDLTWKGRGYGMILDVLTKKYPNPNNELPVKDKLLLNKEVTKIVWDSSGEHPQQVTSVECSDGSVYTADHVIVTVSLGVLKDRYKSLFQPSLPQGKMYAIENLGIAAVAKVFLHFPIRWWPEDFTDFTFLWSQKDLKLSSDEFSQGPKKNGKSWITDIVAFFAEDRNPNVLLVWINGEFVPDIELCSDEIIINGSMFVLSKFLGHQFNNISKPDAVLRSKWYSNPHFRGTYSYQTVKSRQGGVSPEGALSQPLNSSHCKQTLLFAGEATHPFYYSTVHGAIETGFREADRIIHLYK